MNERSAKRENVTNSQIKAAMQLLREHGHLVQDIDELAREVYTFDELMALFRKRRLQEHGPEYLAWRHHLRTTNPAGQQSGKVHEP